MWRFNGHGPRILRVALGISLLTLALLVWIVWNQVSADVLSGVTYDATSYTPKESGPFCPGDVLHYEVEVTRDRIAPLDIRRSFCYDANGICVLELARWDFTTVYDFREPITSTRTLQIPHSARMIPGDWVYVHQIAVANSSNWQTYVVPFTVRDDCP